MNAPSGLFRPTLYEMCTWSGGVWNLAEPRTEDVDFGDIAEHLARICRFGGAVDPWWSVASHSRLVADILADSLYRADLRPYGLLHDGHEAYLGDRITPLARAEHRENRYAADNPFRRMKEQHDHVIFAAARLPWPLPPLDQNLLARADALACSTEMRQFLRRPPADTGPAPLPLVLKPEPVPEAAASFRRALAEVGIGA